MRWIVIVCLAVAGCGYNSGTLQASMMSQAVGYQLAPRSVRVVRTVAAPQVSTSSLFGVIPLSSTAVYATAMDGLYRVANLQPNEIVLNAREDVTTRFYVFWSQRTVTLSADVFAIDAPASQRFTAVPEPAPPQATRPEPEPQAPPRAFFGL